MTELRLRDLAAGLPALTKALGRMYAEAASVCLANQKHGLRVVLLVRGDVSDSFVLRRLPVNEQMRLAFADLQEATELGAVGVAILLAREITGLTVIERSAKGTGIDYWLGDVDGLPFQNKARLEVSGILSGSESILRQRVRRKSEQSISSDATGLPAYIVVVEFGDPMAEAVKR